MGALLRCEDGHASHKFTPPFNKTHRATIIRLRVFIRPWHSAKRETANPPEEIRRGEVAGKCNSARHSGRPQGRLHCDIHDGHGGFQQESRTGSPKRFPFSTGSRRRNLSDLQRHVKVFTSKTVSIEMATTTSRLSR
jgi:hypothetical protein